jgi:hypothetical protein
LFGYVGLQWVEKRFEKRFVVIKKVQEKNIATPKLVIQEQNLVASKLATKEQNVVASKLATKEKNVATS